MVVAGDGARPEVVEAGLETVAAAAVVVVAVTKVEARVGMEAVLFVVAAERTLA